MRLIDADELDKVKYHPLPYTHITPSDVDVESYKRGWNDAIDAIMSEAETIEVERKTEKWIPCSERLPEPDREVFVYLFDKCPFIAWVDDGGMWNTDDFIIEDEDTNPQAWMPLPEPWKGSEE